MFMLHILILSPGAAEGGLMRVPTIAKWALCHFWCGSAKSIAVGVFHQPEGIQK